LFRKILIANRGEIALRIIRTCKKLRVKTVAVYSDSDAELKHVVEADQAYNIGPGEPSQSYLNIPRIVGVARESGAEGLHPGYGFLAENPELARDCEESGIVFIGPPSRVLGHVANKLESKKVVSEAGIPAIPGSEGEILSAEKAEAEAGRIGFPVLVKAVFGGGGRGMRIVKTPGELRSALERAGAEAITGFGRSDLYLEKYLEKPRHIEVQVIAGRRGKMIHLGERECSLQRRYQKILEETPSAVVDDADRERLVGLALKVARVTHYENAGTMEFIRSKNGKFYYMETNKRIQVEHLITEMVTGVDIVEEQLRIASGDGLNLSQNEIEFSGAAINCRINAEDPSKGFVPTPGRVTRFVPPGGPGVRVDTALFNGCPVPEYYDSLIAKIACLARTRDDAIRRISTALGEIVVEGVQTTIPIHQMLLRNRLFEQGDYDTQLLDKLLTQWRAPEIIAPEEAAGLYVALNHQIAIPANNAHRLSPQNKWRTPPKNFDGPKPALFVEV
jgi:acetyl-CoA carboxylase, biotin carboxylase subunit